MTVESSIQKSGPFVAAGTAGTFPRNFLALDASHVRVIRVRDGEESDIESGQVVHTGIGQASGTVNIASGLQVGDMVYLLRAVPNVQRSDYSSQAAIPPTQVESDLDLLQMQVQDLREAQTRALTLGVSAEVTGEEAMAAALAAPQYAAEAKQAAASLAGLDAATVARKPNLYVNVGDFLAGRTDRQAIDAAIASIPAGARAIVRLPAKAAPWALGAGYIRYGDKRVTWEVDDAAVISPATDLAKLNAPVTQGRMVRNPGFANLRDTTALTLISGGGALVGDGGGISGYTSIEQQAYAHERGMAGIYNAVGDGGSIKIPSANFTATTFVPSTPINTNAIRVGMYVDVPGTTFFADAATVRYTSRIVSWAADGSSITVEGWYRANATGNGAVQQTPPNGRPVVINPRNKIWGENINVFLNQTDGDTYGHISGSFIECGFMNNTGTDATGYFDQNTHPLHFYGFDASHKTDASGNGGGISFMSRGNSQAWWRGFESQAATIGFHNANTARNLLSSTAFCASQGTAGGAGTAFLSRTLVGPNWQRNCSIAGDAPTINLGRTSIASTPTINFHSSVSDNEYDARIVASGGTATVGEGTLSINAGSLTLNALLTILSAADIRLTGLPTSAPAASGRLWRDGTTLRIVP